MEIESGLIEFQSNSGMTPGYFAAPRDGKQHPAVVAIQEWWGLVPHIKQVVERFASQGYIALAPDLYHGKTASEPDEARKLSMELDRERAVREIQAAMRYLSGLERVAPKKTGVVGWCMGGSLTIYTAAASDQVAAAVVFYGSPRDMEQARHVQAPLLGLYGEQDGGIPVEKVRLFENALQEAGVTYEIHTYTGAGHAFFNDTRPHAYHAQAAQDAWQRTLDWFGKYLAP